MVNIEDAEHCCSCIDAEVAAANAAANTAANAANAANAVTVATTRIKKKNGDFSLLERKIFYHDYFMKCDIISWVHVRTW